MFLHVVSYVNFTHSIFSSFTEMHVLIHCLTTNNFITIYIIHSICNVFVVVGFACVWSLPTSGQPKSWEGLHNSLFIGFI